MIMAIVCIFIGGYLFYKKMGAGEDKFGKALLTLMGVCLGALAGLILVYIFSTVMLRTTERFEFDSVKLVALGNTSEFQGSFF